jgi:hypothetical protein
MAHDSHIKIEKTLHIAAPEGDAVYVHRPEYGSDTGDVLIETVRHEAMHKTPNGNQYYSRRIYRRRSENNGQAWHMTSELFQGRAEQLAGAHIYPAGLVRLPGLNTLIGLESGYVLDPNQPMFGIGNIRLRTYRSFYRLSHDGGATWSEQHQIIDSRPGYDSTHWAPGVYFGETGGVCDGQPVFHADGAMTIGFSIHHPAAPPEDISERAHEIYSTVIYGTARFNQTSNRLEWIFGDEIRVPFPASAGGCVEPCATVLDNGAIFNTMRCQGDEKQKIYSSRQTTLSSDRGLTWSKPEPLRYDDDQPVWTPASVHQFFTSSRTGRIYVLGNFLKSPVYGQTPRYPLCIAELDGKSARVKRDTICVIQDFPPGAPKDRRYTNWGQYEDRATGDLILLMPEQPKYMNYAEMKKPEDFTSDCVKYRLTFA